MLTDIPNERDEFRFRELMQSLTKELWHFSFILGCIHVLNSEGIHKKKICFAAGALQHAQAPEVFNTKLKQMPKALLPCLLT